jgi:ribA/ribD-fused uncharacterized protein
MQNKYPRGLRRTANIIEDHGGIIMITPNFDNEFSFCSNFAACDVEYQGKTYKTSEHAFQAAKTLDPVEREWVAAAHTPGEAKRRGRKVHLRADWEEIKDQVMLDIVREKFKNSDMRHRLVESRDYILCEFNYWHDNYWGDCTCEKCKGINGQNKLGKILMQVRNEVIHEILEQMS